MTRHQLNRFSWTRSLFWRCCSCHSTLSLNLLHGFRNAEKTGGLNRVAPSWSNQRPQIQLTKPGCFAAFTLNLHPPSQRLLPPPCHSVIITWIWSGVSEVKAAGIHYYCCFLTDNESKPAAAQNKHSWPSVSQELTDVSASKNENNRLRHLQLRREKPLSVWRVKSTLTLILQPSVAHHPHSKCPAVTSPLDWQTVGLD